MAGYVPEANWSNLLRGLFGGFQSSAAVGASTTDVWDTIRTQAGQWQFGFTGVAQPWDPAAVTAAGTQILSSQGVGAANVSTFRGIAGSWLEAKTRLQGLDPSQQITSREIFTPPWATTGNEDVPSRYRVKSQWQFLDAAGNPAAIWRVDQVAGPLTNTTDLLGQVSPPDPNTTSGKALLGGTPAILTDYEVEQI